MNQERFEAAHQSAWTALEDWLDHPARNARGDPESAFDLPWALREVSRHLALARARGYGPALLARLERLTWRAHQALYASTPPRWRRVVQFIGRDFPALVRQEWRLVALACLLLYGSFGAMVLAVHLDPELVHSVVDRETLADLEHMYDPANGARLGRERDAASDIQMFGFYVRNNTSIGFQTFAGGLLLGLGTVAALLFNGVFLGTVAGHLTRSGYAEPFWAFVTGHSAPELTAIALSTAAGFKLAAALLRPGRKRRIHALRDNAAVGVRLVYGAAGLFLIAAYIEAFWSSIASVPAAWKFLVGGSIWLLLIAYFALAGRSAHAR